MHVTRHRRGSGRGPVRHAPTLDGVVTRWNVARLAVLGSAGVVAVVLGLVLSGAAAPSVLGDPGTLVRWGLPVVETLGQLAAALTVGSLVLAVCILPRRSAAPQ